MTQISDHKIKLGGGEFFRGCQKKSFCCICKNVRSIKFDAQVNAPLKELITFFTAFCLSQHAALGNLILISFFSV
jgi:hypothetical protein